jgi:putative FmdB family regulatory protein
MASYDLVCDDCGHDFEVFRQGFLKDEDRVCPDCGSEDVRQKFTSFLKNIGGASGSGGGCAAPSHSGFG